jgi:hypothetical protein
VVAADGATATHESVQQLTEQTGERADTTGGPAADPEQSQTAAPASAIETQATRCVYRRPSDTERPGPFIYLVTFMFTLLQI